MEFTVTALIQSIILIAPFILILFVMYKTNQLQQQLTQEFHQLQLTMQDNLQKNQGVITEKIAQGQLASQQLITESIQHQMIDIRKQIEMSFKHHRSEERPCRERV